MARDLTTDLASAFSQSQVIPLLFADFEFDSGTVRFWSGIGDIEWNGFTWVGLGNLVGISPYSESQSLDARGLSFQLNGISTSILSIILNEPYQGRRCHLWFGAIDAEGQNLLLESGDDLLLEDGDLILLQEQIIQEPYRVFTGIMDTISWRDDGNTADVTVNAENALIILTQTRTKRYTDQEQQALYPGDKFFEFIPSLQTQEVIWKAKT